jgi:hypothetical protein
MSEGSAVCANFGSLPFKYNAQEDSGGANDGVEKLEELVIL